MADHLARIFGTEEDKVNCPFYYKIGACRHGERCSRTHMRPQFSQTILIPHMYAPPPPALDVQPVDDTQHFEDFYEELLEELDKFGEIEQLHVVENLGDHMFGNVYVKFHSEEEAEKCCNALRGRYYAGRLVMPEYSPVTDFREARCRQFDEDHCNRGGYCNFMHLKHVPPNLKRVMEKAARRHRDRRHRRHSSRSRSPARAERGHGTDRRRGGDDRGSRHGGGGDDRRGGGSRDDDRRPISGKEGEAERRARIAACNTQKAPSSGPSPASGSQKENPSSSSGGGGGGSTGGSSGVAGQQAPPVPTPYPPSLPTHH